MESVPTHAVALTDALRIARSEAYQDAADRLMAAADSPRGFLPNESDRLILARYAGILEAIAEEARNGHA